MPKPRQEHPDRLGFLLHGHVPRKRRHSQAMTYGVTWRGCEGPAEFTINGGMHEETHSGTWEAPEIVSLGECIKFRTTQKALFLVVSGYDREKVYQNLG